MTPMPMTPMPMTPMPMTAWRAFRDGAARVAHAPAMVLGVWLLNLLVALPLTVMLRDAIAEQLGPSLRAEDVSRGFDVDWWNEFQARAGDVGKAFGPEVIGFAAPLKNFSDLADGRMPTSPVLIAVATWLVLWTFLTGGIIDRYARNRPTRAHGFFSACGDWFGRMVRLGLIAGILYYLLFTYVHPLLFDRFYGWITHDTAVERTAFLYRVALYVVFGLMVVAVHIWVDVARVRAVVEDRRSMLYAAISGWRFLRQHLWQVLGLYALIAASLVLLLAVYALVAPGPLVQGGWVWMALFVSQLYLIGRLWLKLQVAASLVALYQADFGRALHESTAAAPVWPESPPADAIESSV
jgi:hypothetical protein